MTGMNAQQFEKKFDHSRELSSSEVKEFLDCFFDFKLLKETMEEVVDTKLLNALIDNVVEEAEWFYNKTKDHEHIHRIKTINHFIDATKYVLHLAAERK